MTTWIFIIGALYLLFLVLASFRSYRKNESAEDYLMAGSNVGMILGLLTFAATLFSTFTLMGMPDFFRNHGVGAWIFLAVSDGVQVFFLVWFGYHLRRRIVGKGFHGMSGLMNYCYQTRLAGYVILGGVFLFLIPYVAIQIRGIAIFLNASFPEALPPWLWSTMIVVIMLIYSEVGGLKAIIYSDVMQGLILLIVVYFVAINCINDFGGVRAMFNEVKEVNEALLSTPGPQGLFTSQFLFASMLAIMLLPVTQPQLTTRIIIMKNTLTMYRMAVGVGTFAILIILPTAAIGLYGAMHHPDASTSDFLASVLLYEQPGVIAGAAVIGLIAAAMSTSDSQIFALGTEFRSLLSGKESTVMIKTKVAILLFAVAALIFSIFSSDELVLLARTSFAGTSLLAPMILSGIFAKEKPGKEVVIATGIGILIFLARIIGILPAKILAIRMDLLLLCLLTITTLVSIGVRKYLKPYVN